MPEVDTARRIIVCLFVFGLLLSFAGHRYQSHQRASSITWHDVNTELQQVETARVELFEALNQKIASRQ